MVSGCIQKSVQPDTAGLAILFEWDILQVFIITKMDTAYLKTNFGECLTRCLAEVSEKRPRDPIEYIAQWLYKHIENQKHYAEVSITQKNEIR